MATSPLLLIPHIVQGQKQKEVTANQAFDILESAIAATSTFDAPGTASTSLGDIAARPIIIDITGALTGVKTIIVPQRSKLYIFKNSTTGGFNLQVDTGIGVPLLLANGLYTFVYCDGTNCQELTRLITEHTRTLTAVGNVETFDKIIFCDTTTSSFTITLPSVVPIGRRILIAKIVAANTLTIGRNSNTINLAAADPTITTNQQAIEVIGQAAGNWLAYRTALV